MSPLTKVFVVLLVVCSLLLTAAVVVFVNRVENFHVTAQRTQERLAAEQLRADTAEADREAARQSEQALRQQFNTRVQAMNQALAAAQQQISEKNVQLAELSSRMAMQSANVSQLTEGLRASEQTKSLLQQQVAELRQSGDDLIRRTSELNQTVADLTNRLDVTERQRRHLQEQLTETQTQAERFSAMLRDLDIDPRDPRIVPGRRAGAPPITGVVRDIQVIGGQRYATINVGSADNVRRQMEFQVVDPERGQFLGVLVVDSVEPNEAIGRLSGPRLDEIQPGTQVRTQL